MKKILLLFLTALIIITISLSTTKDAFITTSKIKKDYLILVNKDNPLSSSYIPSSLIPISQVDYIIRKKETMLINDEVLDAYINLEKEAQKQNIKLTIFSAYRSYKKQKELWETTDANQFYLAKPGMSEHQTGLAIDISTRDVGLTLLFYDTKAYIFLDRYACEYGFINRYPLNKEHITGYYFEPWHFRYVGVEHAKKIKENNLVLEEYLNSLN